VLAVQISRHGGPEELVPVELPNPVAAEGQVVVRNRWVAASHYLAAQPDRAAAVSAVLAQVTAGQLSPRIAARFPLRRASQAHALLASRTVTGKVLLQA
jgi:NADPH:quinone reductase-like Zn-dependent oxidoreductase